MKAKFIQSIGKRTRPGNGPLFPRYLIERLGLKMSKESIQVEVTQGGLPDSKQSISPKSREWNAPRVIREWLDVKVYMSRHAQEQGMIYQVQLVSKLCESSPLLILPSELSDKKSFAKIQQDLFNRGIMKTVHADDLIDYVQHLIETKQFVTLTDDELFEAELNTSSSKQTHEEAAKSIYQNLKKYVKENRAYFPVEEHFDKYTCFGAEMFRYFKDKKITEIGIIPDKFTEFCGTKNTNNRGHITDAMVELGFMYKGDSTRKDVDRFANKQRQRFYVFKFDFVEEGHAND